MMIDVLCAKLSIFHKPQNFFIENFPPKCNFEMAIRNILVVAKYLTEKNTYFCGIIIRMV